MRNHQRILLSAAVIASLAATSMAASAQQTPATDETYRAARAAGAASRNLTPPAPVLPVDAAAPATYGSDVEMNDGMSAPPSQTEEMSPSEQSQLDPMAPSESASDTDAATIYANPGSSDETVLPNNPNTPIGPDPAILPATRAPAGSPVVPQDSAGDGGGDGG